MRALWRNRTNKKIFTQTENHDEKLAHRIMEAEKSHNMLSTSWRLRKAFAIVLV